MMNFNVQHFRIWTTSVINICIRSYCLSSELYIATALETQKQAKKILKTNCTHTFYPRWSVLHSSLATFGHMLTFIRYMKVILHMHFWIVFVITRILLNQGSLYQASVPYILLSFWMGWRKLFVIPRTSLYRGLLNRGSTVVGTYVPHPRGPP